MRVTSTGRYDTLSAGLENSLNRVTDLQAKLSSGKRVNRLSDDPVAATSANRLRAQESDWGSWKTSAQDALGFLGSTDSALQSMSTLLQRVQQLAIGAVNGATSSQARGAVADEVDQLTDQLKDLSNTSYLGKSVFGGFSAGAVTKTGSTYSFTGDSGKILRQVSPTVTLAVNTDGAALLGFQPGKTDVFTTLSTLSAAIRSGNNAQIGVQQQALTGHFDAVTSALGTEGATMNRVQSALDLGAAQMEQLSAQRSELEDVDLADTILHLNEAQTGYQAALGAAAKANLPSLAEFLH